MDEPRVPNFKEYAESWLAVPLDWKESTRQEYEHDLRNHVFPKFKNTGLAQSSEWSYGSSWTIFS